jgi:MFS family permease
MGQVRTVPYRRVLRTPGAPSLYGLALVARIPVAAAPAALTLRVVLGLHKGFAQSGLIAAAVALGMAAGAPVLGRLVDHRGARTVLALTSVAQALFWVGAATLPYGWLVPVAVLGGVLSLPVFSLARQAITALLPAADRRAGLSLDSMGVEISYSIGPALGVLAVTRLGSATAMLVIGASLTLAGAGLFLLNPATNTDPDSASEDTVSEDTAFKDTALEDAAFDEGPAGFEDSTAAVVREATPIERRTTGAWERPTRGLGGILGLGPAAMAALVATMGATFALSGTDISLTASMRSFGHISLLGVVFAVWCFASLAGGFVYGTMPRGRDPLLLLVGLAGLTVLLALAGSWWALMLLTIPSGLFCAPLLASTANVIAGTVEPRRRGRALGIHTSALTLGNAAGAPLAGWAVDRWSPPSGFVTVGALGTLLAVAALVAGRRRYAKPLHQDTDEAVGLGAGDLL